MPIPPSSLRGAGRRDGARQPVGLEHHRRQGRLPPQLVANQSARCLAAYLYTAAGLGESTTDLAWDGHALIYENGDAARRVGALRRRLAAHLADVDLERLSHERMRQNALRRSRSRRHARRGRAVPRRRASTAESPTGASCRWQRQVRALPLRAGRPAHARRALQRGVQHPGAGPGEAPARRPASEAGDRRLGRARLDAGADRLRAGDGPARPAAHQHPRLHHAGLRHQRRARSTRRGADGGDRLHAPRKSTSARAACRC